MTNVSPTVQTEKSQSVLAEAEEIINGQRRKDYGGVTESFGNLADLWSAYLERHVRSRLLNEYPSNYTGPNPVNEFFGDFVCLEPQDVANLMILMKVSRAQNGFHRDSYVDIAGYAGCAEKIQNGE